MTVHLKTLDLQEMRPRITVFGVGGAGGNAVNNMITSGLQGVDFVVANTDAQALMQSLSERRVQLGLTLTEGLGAGSSPDIGRAAAEEAIDELSEHLSGCHMAFITAGMGGGTGTGAAPVIAKASRELGVLTVGVVTKPFAFEGVARMRSAEAGIKELARCVDTLIIIPNQNLFRVASEKTTFTEAFALADEVLRSGVSSITDLMIKEGLINLDFADVRSTMRTMGKAMMGTGEASGENRAKDAAEAAISNPLLDDVSIKGAKAVLLSITGGRDLTLYEVDEAAALVREEVDKDANIIVGAIYDESVESKLRVSIVATGIEAEFINQNLDDLNDKPQSEISHSGHGDQGRRFSRPRQENLDSNAIEPREIETAHDNRDLGLRRPVNTYTGNPHSATPNVRASTDAKRSRFDINAPGAAPIGDPQRGSVNHAPQTLFDNKPTPPPRRDGENSSNNARKPDLETTKRSRGLLGRFGFGRNRERGNMFAQPSNHTDTVRTNDNLNEIMRNIETMRPATSKNTEPQPDLSSSRKTEARDQHLEIPAFMRRTGSK